MTPEDSQDIPEKSPSRKWFYISRTCGMILIGLALGASVRLPELMQSSDYLSAFYIAGNLVVSGEASGLYPPAGSATFIGAPFDVRAHELLSHMAPEHTAIYMYSPLVALVFAPLSVFPAKYSLLAWQILSVVALLASLFLMSKISRFKWSDMFWMSWLFLPVFHTILIGQLGLVLGLLPLVAGYVLLVRKKDLAAGLVWSLLILKPQFFPAALIVSVAQVALRKNKCLIGMLAGSSVLFALGAILLSPSVSMQWLECLKLSDTQYADPTLGPPQHLIICLPSAILMLLPFTRRHSFKPAVYAGAALVCLHSLWQQVKILQSKIQAHLKLPLVFSISVLLMPLVQPHFLYYDLIVLLPAGILLMSEDLSERFKTSPKLLAIAAAIAIDFYAIFFFGFGRAAASAIPIVLAALLLVIYILLIREADFICKSAEN